MTAADPPDWALRPGEDLLLQDWWRREDRDGTLFREVILGAGISGAAYRKIDAIRVRPGDATTRADGFLSAARAMAQPWAAVDVIEVKHGLSEFVIGQLLIARWLIHEHARIVPTRMVALVRHVDPALAWAAEKLKIEVAHLAKPGVANRPMAKRPEYALHDAALARLRTARGEVSGTILTRVPLAGEHATAGQWAGSVATYATFVRIRGAGTSAIVVCEGRDHAREMIQDREVDVLVVPRRKRLGRGAFGVALVHGLLLDAEYGPAKVGAMLVTGHPDATLQAAAECLDLDVQVVDEARVGAD